MSKLLNFQKTPFLKKEQLEKKWYVIDAKGKVLGRVASLIASYLRGKHKSNFTPNQVCGDSFVVINVKQISLTGNKEMQKKYYRHSGYPGGLYVTRLEQLKLKYPERILKFAIKGMLPKNKLGSKMLRNVRIFPAHEHNLKSQNPIELKV